MDLGRREPQPEPSPARAPIVPRRRPRIHHSRPGRLTPGARPGRLTARSSPAAELRGGQDARGAAGPVLTHPATSAAGAEASAPAPAVEAAVSAPGAYDGALAGEGDDPLLEQTAGPRGPAQAPPTRRPRSGHAAARRATIIQATTAERGTATQDIPPAGTGRTSHYQSRSSRGRAPAQSLHPILPRLTPTPTIPDHPARGFPRRRGRDMLQPSIQRRINIHIFLDPANDPGKDEPTMTTDSATAGPAATGARVGAAPETPPPPQPPTCTTAAGPMRTPWSRSPGPTSASSSPTTPSARPTWAASARSSRPGSSTSASPSRTRWAWPRGWRTTRRSRWPPAPDPSCPPAPPSRSLSAGLGEEGERRRGAIWPGPPAPGRWRARSRRTCNRRCRRRSQRRTGSP